MPRLQPNGREQIVCAAVAGKTRVTADSAAGELSVNTGDR